MPNIEYTSQIGQDKWVVEEVFKGMKYGYFVELGAADGVFISNTYVLEKDLEWDGLCVDAHSTNFEKLKKNRTCSVDNSFVLVDGKEVEYTEFENTGDKESLFSSIYPPSYYNDKPKTLRKIQTKSLYTIFGEYNVPTIVHYMSMDLEGCEYKVLKDYFEKEYCPTKPVFFTRNILTLSVEHNFLEPARTNLRNLLQEHNFTFVRELMHDDLYINRAIDILI